MYFFYKPFKDVEITHLPDADEEEANEEPVLQEIEEHTSRQSSGV